MRILTAIVILLAVAPAAATEFPELGLTIADRPNGRRGVLVDRVMPNSPAARAGIAAGDIIGAVDGIAVWTVMLFKEASNGKKYLKLVLAHPSAPDSYVTLALGPPPPTPPHPLMIVPPSAR